MRVYLLMFLVACTPEAKPTVLAPTPTSVATQAANPAPTSLKAGPTDEAILQIAKEYVAWGRVDESPGWAPLDCRAPTEEAAQARQSKAEMEHGQKLYFLFAKKKNEYKDLPYTPKLDHSGQIIVKESWTSKEVKESDLPRRVVDMAVAPPPPILHTKPRDGVALLMDQPAPLFVMMYVGKDVKGADNGWWYATVSPDKSKVTASGTIASCQGCHAKAKYDGLFGLQTE
jgi:hypothetical protein